MYYFSKYFQMIFSKTPARNKRNSSFVNGIGRLGRYVEYLARGVGLRTSEISAFSK
jgi:hypothetical protein